MGFELIHGDFFRHEGSIQASLDSKTRAARKRRFERNVLSSHSKDPERCAFGFRLRGLGLWLLSPEVPIFCLLHVPNVGLQCFVGVHSRV